jgi:hypothetical protein
MNMHCVNTAKRMHERRYTVEVLATLSGVGTATVRRYERFGLIEPSRAAG